ncbi:hypothetical protein GQ53DRAFT_251222 [Thozetella sp. PMI_491]|nr:hypothetical protein GQ53DRAFT_251222 [Thozetella sp. PMI_491]
MPSSTRSGGGGDGGSGAPLSPQVSRNGPSQSRFLEGSMNDRVSAAPPPSFLGPEQMAAYERQFYMQPPIHHSLDHGSSAGSGLRRPVSATGPSLAHGKKSSTSGFFAPLWDGVKEKLALYRSRSSSEIGTDTMPKEDERDRKRGPTLSAPVSTGPPLPPGEASSQPSGPGFYPSREEVMESYKNLVASGFFNSHAIQGTRHPLPRAGTSHGETVPPPSRAAPPPPQHAPTKPFAQHMAGHQQRQQQQQTRRPSSSVSSKSAALSFSSVPYSSTRPPTAAELPSSVPPPPREQERLVVPGTRPSTSTGSTADGSNAPRGTKRGAPLDTETHARKLVKKLRKSASRLSADLSLSAAKDGGKPRPAVSAPSSATAASFPPGAFESSAVDSSATVRLVQPTPIYAVPGQRTPTKLKKRGLFAGRRHHSATHHPRSPARSPGLQPQGLSLPHLMMPALPAQSQSQSQSQPSSGRTSLSSLGGRPVPNLQPGALGRTSQDSRTGRVSQDSRTRIHEDLDVMDLDSPRCSRSMSRSVSPDKQGGLAPPSFHYPYRLRAVRPAGPYQHPPNEPLSVVPDANRGIPVVPKIPVYYTGKLSEAGNRDSGIASAEGGAMMGDENYAVSWYRD